MENQISTAENYRERCNQTKVVVLPSGATFKIKKITTRDYIREGGVVLQSSAEISTSSDEKNKIVWEKLGDEQKKQQLIATNKMIVLAVIEPEIVLAKEEGKLCVDEISDDDYYKLLDEITTFSYGRQDLKSFREKSDATNTGHNSEEIRSTPVGLN